MAEQMRVPKHSGLVLRTWTVQSLGPIPLLTSPVIYACDVTSMLRLIFKNQMEKCIKKEKKMLSTEPGLGKVLKE